MKQGKTCIRILAFATFILLLPGQNHSFAQQRIPHINNIPVGSITLKVMVTKDMINKGYYYAVSYVTSRRLPIWTVFYNREKRCIQRVVLPDKIEQIRFNKFSIISPWKNLGVAGPYLIGVMSLKEPEAPQFVIQTLRISSNTKQDLKDNKTLIVDESTGVAPRKGTEKFNIRYQLNETSDMIHKIIQFKDNKEIWKEELTKVQKGTRGFYWNRENVQKGRWYRAEVEAKLVTDKGKWDHDLSDKFQALQ